MRAHTKILVGALLGLGAGVVLTYLGPVAPGFVAVVRDVLDPVGRAFIALIAMVIVPLVFASLTLGVASLGGDVRKLGRLGGKTLAFFLVTTVISILLGVGLALVLRPGAGLDASARENLGAQAAARETLERVGSESAPAAPPRAGAILVSLIPRNPIRAMASGDMLQVIFFAVFVGLSLTQISPQRRESVVAVLEGVNAAMIAGVGLIMRLAPVGVFALVAGVAAAFGLSTMVLILRYAGTVVLGQALVLFVVNTGAVALLGGMGPRRFLGGIRDVLGLAFSTSSSSATLPVTMEACEVNLGVSNEVTSFVAPLGATINMNGTALYQGVTAVFIAQVYGHALGSGEILAVVVTATLAAVGTAGVPGVGMVTLAMVLRSVGLPVEGIALVAGVERLLDMVRSAVNVTGDCACAVVVAASEGELRRSPGASAS